VIKAIKRRHKQELPLNISAVKASDPDLMSAAFSCKPFLGWKQAIEQAGLSYDKILTFHQDEVECLICGHRGANITAHLMKAHSINGAEYREEFPDAEVVCEVVRFRRGGKLDDHPDRLPEWERALSVEYALDRVYEYYKQNFFINQNTINILDSAITVKLIRHLGSWDIVLERLGIDPRLHRQNVRFNDYTLKDVKNWLQKREKLGLKNTSSAVAAVKEQQEGDGLRHRIVAWALAYYNRSWVTVLEESGVDLSHQAYNERHFPDANSVIEAIREIELAGRTTALSDVMLREEDSRVAFAAPRYFGNWTSALKAAGVEATFEDRQLHKKSQVVKWIKKRIRDGFNIDVKSMWAGSRKDPGLFKASFVVFKSWRQAVKAVTGNNSRLIKEASKGTIFSTPKKVIDEMLKLHKEGELTSERRLHRDERSIVLVAMAYGFFGSWRNAAVAAGIDPKSYSERSRNPIGAYKNKDAVIEGIVGRHAQGLPMNARSVATGEVMDAPLITSARKWFGNWQKAIEAAGLDYSKFVRKKQDYSVKRKLNSYPTKKSVVQGIKKRQSEGLGLNSRAVNHGDDPDHPLMRRGVELYGSWLQALEAAGVDVESIISEGYLKRMRKSRKK